MKERTLTAIFCAYLLGALLTFGVAWNVDYQRAPSVYTNDGEVNFVRSMACAIAWPLYLSTKGFGFLRDHEAAKATGSTS